MRKVIVIDVSKAYRKEQRPLWGQTRFENDGLNTVWIREGQTGKQLVDTFFHEMTHVFLGFAKFKGRLSIKQEEELCRMIGQTASSILTRGSDR